MNATKSDSRITKSGAADFLKVFENQVTKVYCGDIREYFDTVMLINVVREINLEL